MDASGYNMSFDKEQLSVLCANYDRRIDVLAKENACLRELVRNLYKRFHGVVLENWSYSTEDFDMLACRMRELGVEVP